MDERADIMTFIDWFAGIGGMRRGLELAGHKCVGYCEADKFAIASYRSMHLITKEQREYLSTLDLKKRQKEILRDEYNNGEWFCNDIRAARATDIPGVDIWGFGAPCQSFSIAGKRAGLDGESGLIREIFRLLRETGEEDRPTWIIYENVMGMLSSNRGFDFLAILAEMDEVGYDAQWNCFDSAEYGVPQRRQRIYTVGHLRGRSGRIPVFAGRNDGKDRDEKVNTEIKVAEATNPSRRITSKCIDFPPDDLNTESGFNQRSKVHFPSGISRTLIGCGHAGNEPKVAVPVTFCMDFCEGAKKREVANTITASDQRGVSKFNRLGTAVCIPILTPDKLSKRQNGRRCKEDGEPQFTLTACDRHGVGIGVLGDFNGNNKFVHIETPMGFIVPAIWYEKYGCYIAIRKLSPRECFRLQGWSDDYFDKAAFVNSKSQLYKQAGNGITVNVAKAVGNAIMNESRRKKYGMLSENE